MNRVKRVGLMLAKAVAAGVLLVAAGMAQAQAQALPFPTFEGRNADGSVNNICTATGGSKCVMIYDKTLNITILNNWNFGGGVWSASAAAGSAQAAAETAGLAATGLSGWRLPTGDGNQSAGALDEFASIWADVGSTLGGLQSVFDGVTNFYWSGSEFAPVPSHAWFFHTGNGSQSFGRKVIPLFAVAVRSGDVVAAVPEPESLALMLVGLMLVGLMAARRRPL